MITTLRHMQQLLLQLDLLQVCLAFSLGCRWQDTSAEVTNSN